MSRIKPRTHGKDLVRHIARFDRDNHETLFAYAEFLREPTDYILNQLVQTVLAKDKEFVTWRAQHAESFVPSKTLQTPTKGAATARAARAPHPIQKPSAGLV